MWQLNFVCFFDIFRTAKCNKIILLQSVIGCYYKVRQVLQSVTVITKWDVTPLQMDDKLILASDLLERGHVTYFAHEVTVFIVDLQFSFSTKKLDPLIYINSLFVFMFLFSFVVCNLQKSFHKLQYICCYVIISGWLFLGEWWNNKIQKGENSKILCYD